MLIELKNVSKEIKDGSFKRLLLEDINLIIDENEILALVGTSGSGKTALLRGLGCLETISMGEYKFNDKLISNSPESALANIRREHIGFIGFNPEFLPNATVEETLAMPLAALGISKKEQKQQIINILDIIGLVSKLQTRIDKLQRYERMYISAARAFIKHPLLIVADNPAETLHSTEANSFFEVIVRLRQEYGGSLVFSTYDPSQLKFAHRIAYLKNGKIIKVDNS